MLRSIFYSLLIASHAKKGGHKCEFTPVAATETLACYHPMKYASMAS